MAQQFRRTYKRRRADATVAGPTKRQRSVVVTTPMDITPTTRYRFRSKSMQNEELKFFDTALSFNFDTTGEVPATGQLVLIPQGDTESTRDGRKAIIKSIQIRGNVEYQPAAAANMDSLAFLMVVLDTQTNGAAATISDVFTNSNMSTNLLNLNNSGRFRILMKKQWTFNATAGVTTAYCQQIRQCEMYTKCNIPIDWNSTAGAITEIKTNNIFLLAGAIGSDDLVVFLGNARVRFVG